jgi:bacteriorhodopsin
VALAALFFAWLVVRSPSIASACSVCTAGRDEENAAAFLITTIFMSVLPLLALGTFVYILWRRFQRLEAESTPPSAPEPQKS